MPDKPLLVKAVAMAMEPPPAQSARGYGYRAPPPPQTVLHPTLQLHQRVRHPQVPQEALRLALVMAPRRRYQP